MKKLPALLILCIVIAAGAACGGSDVKKVDTRLKELALADAARNGELAKVEELVDDGVDVNAKDKFGTTALMWAADKGHKKIVKFLLDKGADIYAKDDWGSTALSRARDKSHTEIELIITNAGGK